MAYLPAPMRFRPSLTVNHSPVRLQWAGVGLLILLVPGCSKTPEAPPSPPEPAVEAQPVRVAETSPAPIATPTPPRAEAPSLPENVADLNARYHLRTTTSDERDEIIRTLGRLDAPQALPALRRIFE